MFLIKNERIKMFNKIILVGNLTRDIEMRNTPTGLAIANTAIATSRKFKSQTGEQKEETCFVNIVFFGRTAEIANQYLRKGSKILVDGRLKLDQWTDNNGHKRSKHSVTVETMQMLGNKTPESYEEQGNKYDQRQPYQPPIQKPKKPNNDFELKIIDDGDIPF